MEAMTSDETLELTESDLGFRPIPESTKAAFSMQPSRDHAVDSMQATLPVHSLGGLPFES